MSRSKESWLRLAIGLRGFPSESSSTEQRSLTLGLSSSKSYAFRNNPTPSLPSAHQGLIQTNFPLLQEVDDPLSNRLSVCFGNSALRTGSLGRNGEVSGGFITIFGCSIRESI